MSFTEQYTQKNITVIIVDDEYHARVALKHALSTFTDIEIIAECENGLAAVKAVHELKPQVLFLDVHMPKLDGFDVLDLLGEDAPLTIFVTAYDEYAIQAFETNALDYLLKPVSDARLIKTLERMRQQLQLLGDEASLLSANNQLLDTYKQAQMPLQRILVRDKSDVHVIPVTEICFIEAADDYVVIHTESQTYIKQERLQYLENMLDSNMFCRIHRSSIINLNFLSGIETESRDNKIALIKNGKRQPVSRSGYQRLVKLL